MSEIMIRSGRIRTPRRLAVLVAALVLVWEFAPATQAAGSSTVGPEQSRAVVTAALVGDSGDLRVRLRSGRTVRVAPCAEEDSNSRRCWWDARARGNQTGLTHVRLGGRTLVVTALRLERRAAAVRVRDRRVVGSRPILYVGTSGASTTGLRQVWLNDGSRWRVEQCLPWLEYQRDCYWLPSRGERRAGARAFVDLRGIAYRLDGRGRPADMRGW